MERGDISNEPVQVFWVTDSVLFRPVSRQKAAERPVDVLWDVFAPPGVLEDLEPDSLVLAALWEFKIRSDFPVRVDAVVIGSGLGDSSLPALESKIHRGGAAAVSEILLFESVGDASGALAMRPDVRHVVDQEGSLGFWGSKGITLFELFGDADGRR